MRIGLKLGCLYKNRTGWWQGEGCLREKCLDTIKLMGFSYWQSGSHTFLVFPYFLGNVQLSPDRTRKLMGKAVFPEGASQCEMSRSVRKGFSDKFSKIKYWCNLPNPRPSKREWERVFQLGMETVWERERERHGERENGCVVRESCSLGLMLAKCPWLGPVPAPRSRQFWTWTPQGEFRVPHGSGDNLSVWNWSRACHTVFLARTQLLCEQSHLFLPSEPCCLESPGLRKQFTFLTPPLTPAYWASSQALPKAAPNGSPSARAEMVFGLPPFEGVLCVFRLSLWLRLWTLPPLSGIPVRNKADLKPARFLSRVFRPDCCALGAGRGSLCRLVVGVPGLGRSVTRQDDFYQSPPPTADLGHPCVYGTRGP